MIKVRLFSTIIDSSICKMDMCLLNHIYVTFLTFYTMMLFLSLIVKPTINTVNLVWILSLCFVNISKYSFKIFFFDKGEQNYLEIRYSKNVIVLVWNELFTFNEWLIFLVRSIWNLNNQLNHKLDANWIMALQNMNIYHIYIYMGVFLQHIVTIFRIQLR